MRIKVKNWDGAGALLGGILVVGLLSPALSRGAVVSVNPQNETPYVSSGDSVISTLHGTKPEVSLTAGTVPVPALPSTVLNNVDFPKDRPPVILPGPAGKTALLPKVLMTSAAIGIGGLALVGSRLLRRKDNLPLGLL